MNDGKLTGLDWQILEFLAQDGRKSVSDIASALNRSRGSIAEHIEKMRTIGVLRSFSISLDYEKLGFGLKAFVRLSASSASHREIVSSVIAMSEVIGCDVLTGSDLLMIQIVARDVPHLRNIVDGLTQYGATQTDVVFATVKDQIDVNQHLRRIVSDKLE